MAKSADMPRVLALDVGSRTIGTAVTDELHLAAHALKTIERRGTVRDVQTIQTLATQYATSKLVVGMPYEMDGSIGHRASRVMVLVDALKAVGFEIELIDEGFSTVEATDALLAANVSRQRRREVIDAMAAQVILQYWLRAQSA